MPNNKDNPKGGSQGSMDNKSQSSMGNKPDREFESQGTQKGFDKQGHKTGNPGKSQSSPGMTDDDEMKTAGGRQGQFSDKDRGNDAEWSPSSGDKLRE
jgi:hypothetical protein